MYTHMHTRTHTHNYTEYQAGKQQQTGRKAIIFFSYEK